MVEKLREGIPSSRVMDDSEDDILLVEDMDEPVKSSSKYPSSSQEVLDAEISTTSSKRQLSSVFSSMVDSVRSSFILKTFEIDLDNCETSKL